jgi:hypothetical protein
MKKKIDSDLEQTKTQLTRVINQRYNPKFDWDSLGMFLLICLSIIFKPLNLLIILLFALIII